MESGNTSSGAHKPPPPRRKACEECFKSKRRCDLDLPSCSRCSRLGLVCQYQVPPQRAAGGHAATASMGDAAGNSIPLLDAEILADVLPYTDDLPMSFMNEELDPDPQLFPMMLHSSAKVLCVTDPVTVDLFNPAGSRLHYIIEMLKSAPSRMVHENGTPWSHPLLYKDHMPQSMHGTLISFSELSSVSPVSCKRL